MAAPSPTGRATACSGTTMPSRLTAAMLALLLSAPAAGAETLLATFSHFYGSAPGQVDPGGTDALYSGFVRVSDQSSGRFIDSFNIATISHERIDRLELTLTFANSTSPEACLFTICVPTEYWTVRIYGPVDNSALDDLFAPLAEGPLVLSALPADGILRFGFSEWTPGADSFDLIGAELALFGGTTPQPPAPPPPPPAPVPLPAGGALLALGLAGGALLRRGRYATH